MYYLYTGGMRTSSLAMTGTVYWEEKQKLIFDIVDQSNGKYLVTDPKRLRGALRPDLQTKSFKDMIEEHRERFVPVFMSKNGRASSTEPIPTKILRRRKTVQIPASLTSPLNQSTKTNSGMNNILVKLQSN